MTTSRTTIRLCAMGALTRGRRITDRLVSGWSPAPRGRSRSVVEVCNLAATDAIAERAERATVAAS